MILICDYLENIYLIFYFSGVGVCITDYQLTLLYTLLYNLL